MTLQAEIYNIKGKAVGKIEVEITEEGSVPLVHEVVTAYLANKRSGTASTKTRSEVRGGGLASYV